MALKSYHLEEKKIPSVHGYTTGFKLDQFIFDAFPYAPTTALFEVLREEEFAPVKNANGSNYDTPDSAKMLVFRLHTRWVVAAGGFLTHSVPLYATGVEVSPLWKNISRTLRDYVLVLPCLCGFVAISVREFSVPHMSEDKFMHASHRVSIYLIICIVANLFPIGFFVLIFYHLSILVLQSDEHVSFFFIDHVFAHAESNMLTHFSSISQISSYFILGLILHCQYSLVLFWLNFIYDPLIFEIHFDLLILKSINSVS